jgi:hypothetical protein
MGDTMIRISHFLTTAVLCIFSLVAVAQDTHFWQVSGGVAHIDFASGSEEGKHQGYPNN